MNANIPLHKSACAILLNLMNVLLLPLGSAGDVLPFIWLGRHLVAAGHEVTVMTAQPFGRAASAAGLNFQGVGNEEDFDRVMHDPQIWQLGLGTRRIFQYAVETCTPYLREIEHWIQQHGSPPDLLLAPLTCVAGHVARERWQVPMIRVHLQPSVMLSAYETPLLLPPLHPILQVLPMWLKRVLFEQFPNPLDWIVGPGLAQVCAQWGIEAPRSFFREWWHSPDGVLNLWPHFFAPEQPDWPQPSLLAGFPLEDLSSERSLDPELASLVQQEAPLVFTAGSANVHATNFFRESLVAVRELKRAAVLLTPAPEQVAAELPERVLVRKYVPFRPLLQHAALLVHHGGVGTMSQAMLAGVPQLIVPMAHDQPDHAERIRALGCGDSLTTREYRAPRLATRIQQLLTNPSVRENCQAMAQRLRDSGCANGEKIVNWLAERQAVACARIVRRRET